MSLPPATVVRTATFRDSPIVRFFGSVISWFLFSLSFTLLVQGVFGVMSVGGACASGNTAYVIQAQCPDVTLFAAPSVFAGLAAVGLSVWLAQGFGTALVSLAWPILFGVLGVIFISALEVVGYIIGGMFIIMALVPLVIALRASAQRVFLGAVNLSGHRFYEGENARRNPLSVNYADSDAPVRANLGNWLLSLFIAIVSGAFGFWLALKIAGAL